MAVLPATGWPDLVTNCIFAIIPHDQFISKQKQPDGQTSRFQRQIAFSLLSRTINLSAAGPSYSYQKQLQCAKATGWPDLQISATNCIFAIIPHDQFISGRAWPFYQREAVLSRRKQPGGQTSRFQRQIPSSLLSRTINLWAKLFSAKAGQMAVLSTRGPMPVLSRQKQPDGQTSTFQRQIAFFAIIPHDQFISGRAKRFLAKAGPLTVLSTRGPMAVSSRAATG